MTDTISRNAAEPELNRPRSTVVDQKEWQEPKLNFVEPELTSHGELKELTGGFFGSFQP